MRIGVIGLGAMGGRIAEALAAAGHTVVGCDVSPETRQRMSGGLAECVAEAQDAARGAAAVLLSLPAAAQVESAVAGPRGVLQTAAPGSVVVDLSTVEPATSRGLAEVAAARGIGYLDAPVLGRPHLCGQWTLPVGGEADTLEQVRPLLEVLASRVLLVGPSGSGNALKLLNALLFGAINAATAEIMAIAPRVGLSREVFFEAVANSSAATVSPLFREVGAKILARDFAPVFTLDLLHKDNGLGLSMARDAGAPLILATTVQLLNELGQAQGCGTQDSSALVRVYEALMDSRAAEHA